MSDHMLKIQQQPYIDLFDGVKTCEVRECSDRDFQVGDTVILNLINQAGEYTGHFQRRKITHVQRGFGLPDNLCVLSYENVISAQPNVQELLELQKLNPLRTISVEEKQLLSGVANGLGITYEQMARDYGIVASAPAESCKHEWTDDGQWLQICTLCGRQEDHDPKWRDMDSAPRDGTLLRLLVEFDEHSTEDSDQAPTIGANNFDHDGLDEWKFAGWCWTHDHFTEGKGTPVGWLPLMNDPVIITPYSPAEQPQDKPE